MAGRSQATLHVGDKEIFSIVLDKPGAKLSERIAELCAEVMKGLNARMGASAPAADEVDMLEEPVSGDDEEDAGPGSSKKGEKRRRRSQG